MPKFDCLHILRRLHNCLRRLAHLFEFLLIKTVAVSLPQDGHHLLRPVIRLLSVHISPPSLRIIAYPGA